MPNEIYHRSNWGNANAEGFGDVYFDAAATNKLYNHSDYYENSDGTDKILRDLSNKASITLTPTAYSNGSLNTVIPPYQVLPTELVTNGDFSNGTTSWTLDDASNGSISVVDGKLEIVSNGGAGYPVVKQGISTSIGKKYSVTFSVTNNTTGFWFRVSQFESGLSGDTTFYANDKTSSINFKGEFTAISTTSYLKIFAEQNDAGSFEIDNISIKEIQEADFDFSRGSSATRVNEKGLIESIASNLQRIDYTSGFGSLLLEPSRRNDIPYSQDFSIANWIAASGATKEYNVATSPDGSQNASRFNYDGTSNGRVEYSSVVGLTSGISYTISVYLKSESGNIENVQIGHDAWGLKSVTVTNEWQRFTQTVTSNSTSAYPRVRLDTAGSILVWGYQLEAGSYATSYIPTSGSTVTRSADIANNSGNADLINSTEGVLYAEIAALADVDGDASLRFISLSNGTSSKRITIYYFSSETFGVQLKNDGYEVTDLYIGGSVDRTQFNKIALYYSGSNLKAYLNGIEVFTNSSWIPFPDNTINTLNFDGGDGGNDFYGKTKELAVFKEALTDAELESLTSWVSFTEMATDLEYTLE